MSSQLNPTPYWIHSALPRSTEHLMDGLDNYSVQGEIGRGTLSVISLATSRRGRMRGRRVAMKKILRKPVAEMMAQEGVLSTTAIHLSLCHPSIVSLLSSFSTHTAHYHILEYCSNSSLESFLQSREVHALSEDELRGVLRGVVDGLTYLRKELVIHRDINPRNILLNDQFRVKISDFSSAVRLPFDTPTTSGFAGSLHYVSPEMAAGAPYGFPTDLWSLGSLIVTSLTGVVAFEADSEESILDNILHGTYTLLASSTHEARDLVQSLLQLDPNHRILLEKISIHPFFDPSLCIQPLAHQSSQVTLGFGPPQPNQFTSGRPRHGKYPASLSIIPQPSNQGHPDSSIHLNNINKKPIRNFLSGEWKCPSSRPVLSSVRRISSAPQPSIPGTSTSTALRQTRFKNWNQLSEGTPTLTDDSGSVTSTGELDDCISEVDKILDLHPLLSYPDKPSWKPPHGDTTAQPTLHPSKFSATERDDVLDKVGSPVNELPAPIYSQNLDRISTPLPTLTNTHGTLEALNTSYLSPRTHKLAKGQLTILPSLSLLIDLREAERRRGRPGNEVLLISADGVEVQIHSAPHLSSPCCLAEPTATYTLDNLPHPYHKQYKEATHVVEQMKQRIPKLILYKPEAQCTLMANTPLGVMELLMPPPNKYHREDNSQSNGSMQGPRVRVRLFRQSRTLEVSKRLQGTSGTTEWTKKVMPTVDATLRISNEEWGGLEPAEQDALKQLSMFIPVCMAAEPEQGQTMNVIRDQGTQKGVCHSNRGFATRPNVRQASSHNPTKPAPDSEFSPSPFLDNTKRPWMRYTLPNARETIHSSQPTARSDKPTHESYTADALSAIRTLTRYVPRLGWCTRKQRECSVTYHVLYSDGGDLEIETYNGQVRNICYPSEIKRPIETKTILTQLINAFSDNDS